MKTIAKIIIVNDATSKINIVKSGSKGDIGLDVVQTTNGTTTYKSARGTVANPEVFEEKD